MMSGTRNTEHCGGSHNGAVWWLLDLTIPSLIVYCPIHCLTPIILYPSIHCPSQCCPSSQFSLSFPYSLSSSLLPSSLSTFLLSHIEFTSFLISLPLFFNFSIFSMSFFSLLSIYCPRSTVQSASVESIDTAQRGPILVRQMYYKSSVISLLSYYLPTASLSSHCTTASSSLFSMLYGIRSARSSSRRYMAIIMVHLM